ncbi:site-specific integrase [Clostridium botulinum]|uniref:Site-specific recombinase, phage integrase family n=1 Tax=Clostridium botulinum (strain Okra / Type B1) TaxID=498213 RepID=B1IJ27_CLOBK|nr:site-specific integrase [Clostridium botulinum]EKX80573.1 phage integrase site specific recombinase [Clostridium botulinum CFSAN001628]ACA45921.1 site-specific recombinase, phage integrase family [Clostridium botulinum B1 str. Okra]MBD5564436.1 site-specific integrase [Clostridium botulinum]MBD5566954.1 site-specific integrase [Clostridium botulinum]MBD5570433.1 site-specific integrase [Clostridium botulinum]
MNFVEPIRDKQKVRDIQDYLKQTNPRNYIMFITGVYTGLRISDILKLKVKDVKNKEGIYLREKKTSKQNIIALNKLLIKEYKWFCGNLEDYEYLIKSREGINKPLSRVRAYEIIRKVGKDFGVENLGTHTMRKTFGYHYYKKTKDIGTLMNMFNHSAPSITLKYIGISQDTMNKARREFNI